MVVRWIAALIAFLVVVIIGIVGIGNFATGIDPDNFFDTEGANSFALIGAIGARRRPSSPTPPSSTRRPEL